MARRRQLLWDSGGAAYVEFLLAFTPLFLLFLGIIELSLVFGARLVVDHAALRAARAAAVTLPDDPRYYDREPPGEVLGRPMSETDLVHALSRLGVGVASGEIGSAEPLERPLSRRATVELAAALVVLPLATASGVSVSSAVGSEGLRASASATRDALEVEIDPPPRAGEVSVTVRYRYQCRVPLARELVCLGGEKVIVARERRTVQGASYDYAAWWSG